MVQKTSYESVGYNTKGKQMWAYTLVPPLSKYVWPLPDDFHSEQTSHL